MRVLFFIDSLISGGKERRLIELLKGLGSFPDLEYRIAVMNENVHFKEIFDLGIQIDFIIRKSKKDLSVLNKLYHLCKTFKPDIVHCWDSMTAIYSIPICKILHIKVINGMVTDTLVRQNIRNKPWLRARLTFPFSDLIIGNSLAGLKSYGVPKQKAVCIYNGLDISRFDNMPDSSESRRAFFNNITDETFIIGMVAAFELRKDYQTVIKSALKIINLDIDVRYMLIGAGSTFDLMKALVPEPVKDKILFPGNRNDVEKLVNIIDAGVLCTNSKYHGEGISNSILEYMALSKPVIATTGGGTEEVVINGINGFLIESGNVEQLTEKIIELFNNRQLSKGLGTKGRENVLQNFNSKKMALEYYKYYKELLK